MKRTLILFCTFFTLLVMGAQKGVKQYDFSFCTTIYGTEYMPNVRAYVQADRIPGNKNITVLNQETGLWIYNHWEEEPISMIKRPITAHDKKVKEIQDGLLRDVNGGRIFKFLGIAYEEYSKRDMDLKPFNEIFALNIALKKSKQWRYLKERQKDKQNFAKKSIEQDIAEIRSKIDNLFIAINAKLQDEYTAWAQEHPEQAQQIVFKKRIEQAEARAEAAEIAATLAAWDAEQAEQNAAAAMQSAEWAESEAEEARRDAKNANRRANDAQFRLDANGIW